MIDYDELKGTVTHYSSTEAISLWETDSHIGCFAQAGKEKDNRVLLPILYSVIQVGESAIIHDPDAKLYKKTSGLAKQLGYRLVAVNFADPKHSFGWNPLVDIIEQMDAGDIISTQEAIKNMFLMLCPSLKGSEDSYRIDDTRKLGAALTEFYLASRDRKHINFHEIYKLVNDVEHKKVLEDKEWKLIYLDVRHSQIFNTILSYTNLKKDVLSHICADIKHALEIFVQNMAYQDMFSQDDFSIEDCLENKTLIYLITPEERTTYQKLVALFIKQSYDILTNCVKNASDNRTMNRINYVLKEFDTIPSIPDFVSMLSASREENIRFLLDMQSLDILRHTYQNQSSAILNNLADIVYLYSKEKDVLEYISFLCGKKVDGRIFTPADIQQLKASKGEALWLSNHRKPYITTLADIEECNFELLPEHPLLDTMKNHMSQYSIPYKEIRGGWLREYERNGKRDVSDEDKDW